MEYIFTFLEGFASFISPCILPMLPVYISYFAGKDENKKDKKILNSIGFVLGFTLVFFLMSIFASTFGKFIGEYLKYIKIIFGLTIIILGCNYMGLFKIEFLNRTRAMKIDANNLNLMKSIVFGMLFSVSLTPCVGAFLSSALMLIANEQNIMKGIILILLYCIGLGIPFIISAVFLENLKESFNFIKKNYRIINIVSGVILIGMGIYLIFS